MFLFHYLEVFIYSANSLSSHLVLLCLHLLIHHSFSPSLLPLIPSLSIISPIISSYTPSLSSLFQGNKKAILSIWSAIEAAIVIQLKMHFTERSIIYTLLLSFIHSLTHSLTHLFTLSLTHSLVDSVFLSLFHTCTLTQSQLIALCHSHTLSLILTLTLTHTSSHMISYQTVFNHIRST